MSKILYFILGLIFGVPALVFALSTFLPYQGGTGTATAPTYGQLLVGTSAGVYIPQATSTLGLQGTFERDWKIVNSALIPTTTLGIIVSASSTVGNGTDGGGFTINGSATTTATSTFNGRTNFTATKSYASSISTGGMVNISNGTTNIGTALDVYSNVGARTGRLAVFYDQNASANVDTVLIQSDATGNTPLNVQTSATSKTAIKVEHNGSGTGFSSASLLSLDKKSATDIQGIFGDSTGGASTGSWLNLKNNGTQVFVIGPNGQATTSNATSTGSLAITASTTVGGFFNAVNGGFLSVNAATTTALQVANLASTTNLIVSSSGGTAGCATFSTNGTISNTGVACGTGAGGNPFTNPTATSFATTSGMVINNASSTFVGSLTITGGATTSSATTTSLTATGSTTVGTLFGAGLSTCNAANNFLTWISGSFGCGSASGFLSSYNAFTNPTATSFATTSGMVVNNASSTFVGSLTITGNATTTNATTTGSLAVNASSTIAGNFNVGGQSFFGGSVGIGTTTPNGQLDVIRAGGSDTAGSNTILELGASGSAKMALRFGTAGVGFNLDRFAGGAWTNVMTWDRTNDSNVGIGTSSPTALLEVSGTANGTAATTFTAGVTLNIGNRSTTANNFEALAFRSQDVTNAGATSSAQIVAINTLHTASVSSGDLVFQTLSAGLLSERARITAAGRVGIATTTPQAPLHVAGTGNSRWQTIFEDTSAGSDMHLFGFDYVNGVLRHDILNDSLASTTIITEATSSTSFFSVTASTSVKWPSNHVDLFSAGPGATSTHDFGELGDTTGKTCFNGNRTDGGPFSIYVNAAGTLITETNYCR